MSISNTFALLPIQLLGGTGECTEKSWRESLMVLHQQEPRKPVEELTPINDKYQQDTVAWTDVNDAVQPVPPGEIGFDCADIAAQLMKADLDEYADVGNISNPPEGFSEHHREARRMQLQVLMGCALDTPEPLQTPDLRQFPRTRYTGLTPENMLQVFALLPTDANGVEMNPREFDATSAELSWMGDPLRFGEGLGRASRPRLAWNDTRTPAVLPSATIACEHIVRTYATMWVVSQFCGHRYDLLPWPMIMQQVPPMMFEALYLRVRTVPDWFYEKKHGTDQIIFHAQKFGYNRLPDAPPIYSQKFGGKGWYPTPCIDGQSLGAGYRISTGLYHCDPMAIARCSPAYWEWLNGDQNYFHPKDWLHVDRGSYTQDGMYMADPGRLGRQLWRIAFSYFQWQSLLDRGFGLVMRNSEQAQVAVYTGEDESLDAFRNLYWGSRSYDGAPEPTPGFYRDAWHIVLPRNEPYVCPITGEIWNDAWIIAFPAPLRKLRIGISPEEYHQRMIHREDYHVIVYAYGMSSDEFAVFERETRNMRMCGHAFLPNWRPLTKSYGWNQMRTIFKHRDLSFPHPTKQNERQNKSQIDRWDGGEAIHEQPALMPTHIAVVLPHEFADTGVNYWDKYEHTWIEKVYPQDIRTDALVNRFFPGAANQVPVSPDMMVDCTSRGGKVRLSTMLEYYWSTTFNKDGWNDTSTEQATPALTAFVQSQGRRRQVSQNARRVLYQFTPRITMGGLGSRTNWSYTVIDRCRWARDNFQEPTPPDWVKPRAPPVNNYQFSQIKNAHEVTHSMFDSYYEFVHPSRSDPEQQRIRWLIDRIFQMGLEYNQPRTISVAEDGRSFAAVAKGSKSSVLPSVPERKELEPVDSTPALTPEEIKAAEEEARLQKQRYEINQAGSSVPGQRKLQGKRARAKPAATPEVPKLNVQQVKQEQTATAPTSPQEYGWFCASQDCGMRLGSDTIADFTEAPGVVEVALVQVCEEILKRLPQDVPPPTHVWTCKHCGTEISTDNPPDVRRPDEGTGS